MNKPHSSFKKPVCRSPSVVLQHTHGTQREALSFSVFQKSRLLDLRKMWGRVGGVEPKAAERKSGG